MRPSDMSDAELVDAAGRASASLRDHSFEAERSREWLDVVLREMAERAGCAPFAWTEVEDE